MRTIRPLTATLLGLALVLPSAFADDPTPFFGGGTIPGTTDPGSPGAGIDAHRRWDWGEPNWEAEDLVGLLFDGQVFGSDAATATLEGGGALRAFCRSPSPSGNTPVRLRSGRTEFAVDVAPPDCGPALPPGMIWSASMRLYPRNGIGGGGLRRLPYRGTLILTESVSADGGRGFQLLARYRDNLVVFPSVTPNPPDFSNATPIEMPSPADLPGSTD